MPDGRLERWLAAVVATPGLTAFGTVEAARPALLEDALRAVPLAAAEEGPIVDVGSGGGTPGIPLAASLPAREVVLLESARRKCAFLEGWCDELPNLTVTWGRAEEQPTERFGLAVAKALADPVVATEWCLPLVREGGAVLLWTGLSADPARVDAASRHVGGQLERSVEGILVLRKTGPTPSGFPRRVGMAKKRPLA